MVSAARLTGCQAMPSCRWTERRLCAASSSAWAEACPDQVRSANRCPVRQGEPDGSSSEAGSGSGSRAAGTRACGQRRCWATARSAASLSLCQRCHRSATWNGLRARQRRLRRRTAPGLGPCGVAYSSTPTTRGAGISGSGKSSTSRSTVLRLTDTPRTRAMRAMARPARARPTAARVERNRSVRRPCAGVRSSRHRRGWGWNFAGTAMPHRPRGSVGHRRWSSVGVSSCSRPRPRSRWWCCWCRSRPCRRSRPAPSPGWRSSSPSPSSGWTPSDGWCRRPRR